MATARRLAAAAPSGPRCAHRCCLTPSEPDHQHLFEPSVCPVCLGLERQAKERGKQ